MPPLSPILKYPGGKSGELPVILARLPRQFQRYYEPFLGGGALFFALPPDRPALVNDKSADLMQLYRCVAAQDADFFAALEAMAADWQALQDYIEGGAAGWQGLYAAFRAGHIAEKDLKAVLSTHLEQQAPPPLHFCLDGGAFWQGQLRTSVVNKLKRMRKLEAKHGLLPPADVLDNLEGALKAAYYSSIRYWYNQRAGRRAGEGAALFYFLREYAYGAMFRFNKAGGFNIPYGGISYNRKGMAEKIARMREPLLVARLQSAHLENLDFDAFLAKHPPQAGDFLFLDPPYDTEFSDYDQNSFDQHDQARLARYLIHDCPAYFMLVIKNTEYILNLYNEQTCLKTNTHIEIAYLDKKYMYNVKERNNRDVVHLIITNYQQGNL